MTQKPNTSNQYLKTQVMTASPEQLQLMLYDGAIRFGEQARQAIEEHDVERSYQAIGRVEKIVMEMASSMRDDLAPETCANMRRLYMFCYDRLVQANTKKNLDALDEALEVLRHLRETWIMLMGKLRKENNDITPKNPPTPQEDDALAMAVGATINLTG